MKLTSKDIDQYQMSDISHLTGSGDVSESEEVETRVSGKTCVHGVERQEDGPGGKPDRKECKGHDSEEANKEVRVKTVGWYNGVVVSAE